MLFKEIEAIFTQKVTEYIQNGYTFNCNTMAGHQGEIAKVDLRKGNEIIRVLMCSEYSSRADMLSVVVGRNTKKIGNHRYETIWNGNLEIVEEMKFFKITENFYVVTEEEYKAINDKQIKRFCDRESRGHAVALNGKAKEIVLPYVNRQRGFKSCKLKDIDRVEKKRTKYGNMYRIIVKGKTLSIG